jgi:uncharacterized protein YneF (UPF0154 family)
MKSTWDGQNETNLITMAPFLWADWHGCLVGQAALTGPVCRSGTGKAACPTVKEDHMRQMLLSLCVTGKKDLVQIRQRTRQLAALLGYGARDQAILAAGVFALACQKHRCQGRTTWNFSLKGRHLHIFPAGRDRTAAQIEKWLPEQAPLTEADIRWLTMEMGRQARVDIFGEIQKLNQELVQALLEVQAIQGEGPMRPAA